VNDTLLRPRSAVEIIDAAFALYRNNFATLAAIAFVLLGPLKVIGVLVGGPVGAFISALSGLFTPIVVGAAAAVVSDAMHDRPISVGSAFGQIAGRWGSLVAVAFVQGILVFLATLLLLIPGIIVFCWTFAAPMIVVVERSNRISGAIGRSRELARGQFWHIFGTLALAWFIVVALLMALGIGVALLGRFAGLSDEITSFLADWAFIVMVPIAGVASSILYFDLRVLNEAYDIERLAAAVTDTTGASSATGA